MPDAQAYADQLQQLAPPGRAFPRDRDSSFGRFCLGWGDEFGRADARGADLIEEAFPDTTDELLPDWERVAGLPDPAIPAPVTLGDRRAALIHRLTANGDPSPQSFIDLVAALGFAATITTHI